MKKIKFNKAIQSLINSLWGNSAPPRLFKVSPSKFTKFSSENRSRKDFMKELKKRLPDNELYKIFSSINSMLYYSTYLFPGFPCFLYEFVNEDWLSMVDFHKGFHRDHIFHQTQTAVALKILFEEISFYPSQHRLAEEVCNELPYCFPSVYASGRDLKISLLDITAYMLAKGNPSLSYLFGFAESLGLNKIEELSIDGPYPAYAFWFWRKVAYDAGITAALYHDIGYPMQFINIIGDKVKNASFLKLIDNISFENLDRFFGNHLCMVPFKAYQYRPGHLFPHGYENQYREALSQAFNITHGLPGALTFLYLNNEIRDWESPNQPQDGILTMELAALAIVMHDMQKVYQNSKSGKPIRSYMRLSFSKDPISFLLTLADLIQSYQRINAEFESPSYTDCKEKKVCISMNHLIDRTDVYFNNNALEIRYVFNQGTKGAEEAYCNQAAIFNPQQEKDFFNPFYGYLDYLDLFERITLEAEIC